MKGYTVRVYGNVGNGWAGCNLGLWFRSGITETCEMSQRIQYFKPLIGKIEV